MQTPDGSLLDILRNIHDLLSKCDIRLPVVNPYKSSAVFVQNFPQLIWVGSCCILSYPAANYCPIFIMSCSQVLNVLVNFILWLHSLSFLLYKYFIATFTLSVFVLPWCRLKVTMNMLILDLHFSSFCTLLLAHSGRSQDKK